MTTETMAATAAPSPAPAPLDRYALLRAIDGADGVPRTELAFRDCSVRNWLVLDQYEGTERNQWALINICTPADSLAAAFIPTMNVRDFRAALNAMWTFLQSRAVTGAEGETTKKLELATPLQTAGGQITAIELREPTARDLITIDPLSGVAKDLAAVVACCGLARDEALNLGVRDFLAAAAWVADFFELAPATGA